MVRARLLVLAAALALAGCSAEPTSEPGPPLDGEWLLTSATGPDGDLELGDTPVTLSIAADLFSGTGPCNSYTGSLDDSGDFPRFTSAAATQMACEPEAVMQLEADYFAALEAVADGTVTDDSLTLTGGGGVELVFETWDPATVEETELDGEWQFTGGSDADGDIVVNGVPVTLLLSQGAVSGQAPCNTYTGAVSDDNGTLYFAPIAQTLMACTDDALTDLETRYLAALQASTTGTVDGENLTLASADTTLEFTLLPQQSVD